MDLSKLPHLSKTDKHAPPPAEPAPDSSAQGQAFQYSAAPAPALGTGTHAWFSAVLGAIFMMMGWSFVRFAVATLAGREYNTGFTWQSGPKAGQNVHYYELAGYTGYTSTAIFLFGFALLLEAVVLGMIRRNTPLTRAFVGFALVVTAIMTLFNGGLMLVLFKTGIMPLQSLLAAGFGGFMTMQLWQMFMQMHRLARA